MTFRVNPTRRIPRSRRAEPKSERVLRVEPFWADKLGKGDAAQIRLKGKWVRDYLPVGTEQVVVKVLAEGGFSVTPYGAKPSDKPDLSLVRQAAEAIKAGDNALLARVMATIEKGGENSGSQDRRQDSGYPNRT